METTPIPQRFLARGGRAATSARTLLPSSPRSAPALPPSRLQDFQDRPLGGRTGSPSARPPSPRAPPYLSEPGELEGIKPKFPRRKACACTPSLPPPRRRQTQTRQSERNTGHLKSWSYCAAAPTHFATAAPPEHRNAELAFAYLGVPTSRSRKRIRPGTGLPRPQDAKCKIRLWGGGGRGGVVEGARASLLPPPRPPNQFKSSGWKRCWEESLVSPETLTPFLGMGAGGRRKRCGEQPGPQ